MKRVYFICLGVLLASVVFSNVIWAQETAVNNSVVNPELMVNDDLILDGQEQEEVILDMSKIDMTSYYTLGTNDLIEITVNRHPELSGQYLVNSEGKIQYEFIGDVYVADLTKAQVVDVLKNLMGEYVISPDVRIKIVGYNSKVIYVIGEVGTPGKIIMRGDTMSVREAVIQANLPTLTAKTTKASLMTPSESGRTRKKKVNLHKLLYEGDLRENYVMKPGDVLYVPPTAMAKVMRVIQPVAAPIGTAAGTGRTVTTGF